MAKIAPQFSLIYSNPIRIHRELGMHLSRQQIVIELFGKTNFYLFEFSSITAIRKVYCLILAQKNLNFQHLEP